MKRIITIQHAQSEQHVNGMVGSWTDWDLTELGRQQAARIGRRLAEELRGEEWVMYSSDLLRAKNTALAVAKALEVEPVFTEVLRERNMGRAVGKSVRWFQENMECQERTVDDRFFSDGESRRDVWLRLMPFYREVLLGPQENLIVVSHCDTLSVLNAMWLELEPESLNRGSLSGLAGGVSFCCEHQGRHLIRRLSDMSYIRE